MAGRRSPASDVALFAETRSPPTSLPKVVLKERTRTMFKSSIVSADQYDWLNLALLAHTFLQMN